MNRTDVKFLTNKETLERILALAEDSYLLQDIDGRKISKYRTMYLDTEECAMYYTHLHGKAHRQKIRIREYVDSGSRWLEIKNKNNKGRTKKKRIAYNCRDTETNDNFIKTHTPWSLSELRRTIENEFDRITLVNKMKTERLTIDLNLKATNLRTGRSISFPELAIIEVKRDGHTRSDMLDIFRATRTKPAKFSKYCIAMALTDDRLQQNRFKQRIRYAEKFTPIKYN